MIVNGTDISTVQSKHILQTYRIINITYTQFTSNNIKLERLMGLVNSFLKNILSRCWLSPDNTCRALLGCSLSQSSPQCVLPLRRVKGCTHEHGTHRDAFPSCTFSWQGQWLTGYTGDMFLQCNPHEIPGEAGARFISLPTWLMAWCCPRLGKTIQELRFLISLLSLINQILDANLSLMLETGPWQNTPSSAATAKVYCRVPPLQGLHISRADTPDWLGS